MQISVLHAYTQGDDDGDDNDDNDNDNNHDKCFIVFIVVVVVVVVVLWRLRDTTSSRLSQKDSSRLVAMRCHAFCC